MTIMLVGGGSGGHITPLLAVAEQLTLKHPDLYIIAVSEHHGKFASLLIGNKDIDQVTYISAGKLRRFHGESFWSRIRSVKRNLLNILDGLRLLLGVLQSLWLLIRRRPDIIFIKGGFVGVPVGLAAWVLRIPYITHESDAVAGLSNRLIGRGARLQAYGMPGGAEDGHTSKGKSVFTGVPIGADFYDLSERQQKEAKRRLNISPHALVLMITGGSNGAQRLNVGMKQPVKTLLEKYHDLYVIHQLGQGNERFYDDLPVLFRERIKAETFLKPLSAYSAAADLIVARAGATTLSEFAAQGKACVVVPNPYLTGGHQLQNARLLESAVVVLSEKELQAQSTVVEVVSNLLDKPRQRARLSEQLQRALPANAAERLADLLLREGKDRVKSHD